MRNTNTTPAKNLEAGKLNESGLPTNSSVSECSAAMRKNNGGGNAVAIKMFGALFAISLIAVSAWNVTLNPLPKSGQSDISLAGIEAMAAGNESSESGSESGNGSESGSESGVGGGVEQCDIYLYNRNYMEDWQPTTASYSAGVGWYIMWKGVQVNFGGSASGNGSCRVPICKYSSGNCCLKSHLDRNPRMP